LANNLLGQQQQHGGVFKGAAGQFSHIKEGGGVAVLLEQKGRAVQQRRLTTLGMAHQQVMRGLVAGVLDPLR